MKNYRPGRFLLTLSCVTLQEEQSQAVPFTLSNASTLISLFPMVCWNSAENLDFHSVFQGFPDGGQEARQATTRSVAETEVSMCIPDAQVSETSLGSPGECCQIPQVPQRHFLFIDGCHIAVVEAGNMDKGCLIQLRC